MPVLPLSRQSECWFYQKRHEVNMFQVSFQFDFTFQVGLFCRARAVLPDWQLAAPPDYCETWRILTGTVVLFTVLLSLLTGREVLQIYSSFAGIVPHGSSAVHLSNNAKGGWDGVDQISRQSLLYTTKNPGLIVLSDRIENCARTL